MSVAEPLIVYPDSDGQPMADNTEQFEWIVTIKENLDHLFRDRPDVFVAGDNLWYPDERRAPDAYVVFGRPKGHRGSYKQWEEGGIPLTVVFEVLSPNNTHKEMAEKLGFYQRYGVEEYYVYDPDTDHLDVWLRRGERFRAEETAFDFKSPRLGIRFDFSGPKMRIWRPDGKLFLTMLELAAERDQFAAERDAERKRAEELAAEVERLRQQLRGPTGG